MYGMVNGRIQIDRLTGWNCKCTLHNYLWRQHHLPMVAKYNIIKCKLHSNAYCDIYFIVLPQFVTRTTYDNINGPGGTICVIILGPARPLMHPGKLSHYSACTSSAFKLKHLACTHTVACNFGVCMLASEHTQHTSGACHALALGLPHYTCGVQIQ